jgi:hypothetical protein
VSIRDAFDKDRRLALLRLLSEQHDYSANASVLRSALQQLRHGVYDDTIQADIMLLDQHGLIEREELPVGNGKSLIVAKLTKLGLDVARGRPHPMVARPSPEA